MLLGLISGIAIIRVLMFLLTAGCMWSFAVMLVNYMLVVYKRNKARNELGVDSICMFIMTVSVVPILVFIPFLWLV